jgi:5-methylcytosine-specific restriction endonuclease McrA
MRKTAPQERAWLLATAKAIARELKQRSGGTSLRVRIPGRVFVSDTDGWYTGIGTLGGKQVRLEIWLDRFSGYTQRKPYAGFYTKHRRRVIDITRRVSKRLVPHRVVTLQDIREGKQFILAERLSKSEFNFPLLEKYHQGMTYYGFYDPTPHFCARAAAFFESVARTLPRATHESEEREVFPQIENRRVVVSHLRRERSQILATERKIRDRYTCKVCGMTFEDMYGEMGKAFAEAHHCVPLARLRPNVRTRIEDLVTVCSNCHRMLHRMSGRREDVPRLRAIVRRLMKK